jgi:adenine-specific DNA-methyltransferase
VVKVLEPAAGGGALAAAVVDELLSKSLDDRPQRIELLLFEIDSRLVPGLEALCRRMRRAAARSGVQLDWKLENADFLLSEFSQAAEPIEHLLTIANPPFLKLNKATDPRALLHGYAVHGQPNLYGLFMAATARLTGPGGGWCFITPRSWMAGPYFGAARRTLMRHLDIDALHEFESRTEGFEGDAVLQETVITWASGHGRTPQAGKVMLTRSSGVRDLADARVRTLPVEQVCGRDRHAMLTIPHPEAGILQSFAHRLSDFGLEVSTGPVVAFRAAAFIRETPEAETVPLLWLQHVQQHRIAWPIRKKREHIRAVAGSAWMLVPNQPMVVMRRFSPKEDERRVTCAALLGQVPGDVIGLENHLNYIYRPGGRMSPDEARGLAAYLVSRPVDAYFRAVAGSTQVNAFELRRLPLPPLDLIEQIGRRCHSTSSMTLEAIDRTVAEVLEGGVPARAAA